MSKARWRPEDVELLKRLRADGALPTEIAVRLGTTPERVRSKCCALGISIRRPPSQTRLTLTTWKLPKRLFETAYKMGISPPTLVRRLLHRIEAENLYDCILGGEP